MKTKNASSRPISTGVRKFKDNKTPLQGGIRIEKSITINRPVEELYKFWRNFENLPQFMHHLESVTILDEERSHWKVKGPAGSSIEWDAGIIDERINDFISWRSLENAEVENAGSVHFTPAPDGRGTEVKVVVAYNPPAGKLGAAVAKFLGEEPAKQIPDDLRRFKQLMESGEIATNAIRPDQEVQS
jgi:uncharacterized membrane protein